MYQRPFFRRRVHRAAPVSQSAPQRRIRVALLMTAAVFVLLVISSAIYLRSISAKIASADAKDVMTEKINDAILASLREGDYDGDDFVSFEKSASGDVTAISSNMTRINELSANVLDKLIGSTRENSVIIHIPLGNLTGASLLMGRGPKIPVKIMILSSTKVEFGNNVVTAGINQTKHQITLSVTVDMEILVPWGTETGQVSSDVLIADTVIVGRVPETYLNMQ